MNLNLSTTLIEILSFGYLAKLDLYYESQLLFNANIHYK